MEKFDNLTFLEILKKHNLHNEPRYRMKEIYELMKITWNEAVNESNSARSDSYASPASQGVQAAGSWINVKDYLPKDENRIMIFCDVTYKTAKTSLALFANYLEDGTWYIHGGDEAAKYEVTHWMPLPNNPR